MAEEAKNKNKLIAIIAGAVLVVAAVVVAFILINKNKGEVLDENFFKTGDNKVVLAFDLSNSTTTTTTGPVAKKMYQVFSVSGDKITGLKVYTEYENEAAAKEADARPEVEEAVKNGQALDHKVNGKYLVASMPESMYAESTVEQLRASAEILEKSINNAVKEQAQTTTETPAETTTTGTTTEAPVVEAPAEETVEGNYIEADE